LARQAQRSAIAVPELKGMEYVDLSRTAITGSGLTAVLDLPNLKSARLDGVMLTDAERSELVHHPTLIGSLNGDFRGRKAPVCLPIGSGRSTTKLKCLQPSAERLRA
jgi:hypothetical protein